MQLIIQENNKCALVQVIRDAKYLFLACSFIHSFTTHPSRELLVCEMQWVKSLGLLLNRNAAPLSASSAKQAWPLALVSLAFPSVTRTRLCQPHFNHLTCRKTPGLLNSLLRERLRIPLLQVKRLRYGEVKALAGGAQLVGTGN